MSPERSLDGAVAVVTGASSGIGEATARTLASHGASVALVARRADRLDALGAELRETGATALPIEADVTDRTQAEAAIQRAVFELGRLDVLVNNAGVMLLGPMADAPVEEWERMIDLNVSGLMYCAKAALPHLLDAAADHPRGAADMINVSSVAGRVVRNGSGVYNASKHAVGAFSESLRQEVCGRHVRVALIEPGAVVTELTDHLRPEVMQGFEERFAGVERLQAQDIAESIAFMVTRPRHVAINEVLIRPTQQEG